MNSKKTLVILSPGFPDSETDSTCLPAQQSLVHSLNQLYPSLRIIILAFQYPYQKATYQWRGNTVIACNGRNRKRFARVLLWISVWRELKKLYQQENIIGLLSFWLDECALTGYYFSKRYKLPHYTWILGQDAREGNRYARWLPLHPGSLIAMSDFLARKFYENYHIRPLYVIPNGIDPAMYPAFAGDRDIDIMGVGSLIPLKQYDHFIEIIGELKPLFPQLKVALCGEGPERKHLQERILANGLSGTVTLIGEKPHAEVLQLLQRSKLMLHTSAYEGFSGACLEALYAGAHVISYFGPQDGWLKHWHIANDNRSMVATALQLLQAGPGLDHSPVLPYAMKDTATQIMELFNKQPFKNSH